MVKQTASKAFMTFILVIVLVFVTAFVDIAIMAPLTEDDIFEIIFNFGVVKKWVKDVQPT